MGWAELEDALAIVLLFNDVRPMTQMVNDLCLDQSAVLLQAPEVTGSC